jgi:hypothetical protein
MWSCSLRRIASAEEPDLAGPEETGAVEMDSVERSLTQRKAPAGVGGTGAGASIFGAAGDNAQLRAFRTAGLGLSRGREADVRRADNAVLLHLGLQII